MTHERTVPGYTEGRSGAAARGAGLWRFLLCPAMIVVLGLGARPVLGAEGRSVAFVSNVDPNIEILARGWVGQRRDIEYIVTPRDLDDLATKLMTLGQARKIASLMFIGHGGDSFFAFMRQRDTARIVYLNARAFRTLAQRHPGLADAFAPGARVVFLACNLGQSDELLQAVGEAFLRTNGGSVVANTKVTQFEAVRDLDGIVLEWIDHPDRIRHQLLPSSWTSLDIEAARSACDAVVGRWRWFNGGDITLARGGQVLGNGEPSGSWQCATGEVSITWGPDGRFRDRVRLSEDGSVLEGENLDTSNNTVTHRGVFGTRSR